MSPQVSHGQHDQSGASPRGRRLWAPAAVLAVVALLALLAFVSGGADGASTTAAGERPAPTDDEQLARRLPADPMALGPVDAPVVMVMWSDFQCPFCGRFARETEPELIRRYVDRGLLRIEWRDFPYIGPESLPAAVAGRAAAEQGLFWEFADVVYAEQRRPRSSDYDAAHLRRYAEQAGLDLSRYDADVAAQQGRTEVEADLAQATALGVTGTPTFLVNGTPVIGAQPLGSFTAVIERAAAEAGRPVR